MKNKEMEYDFCIIITTFNREKMLKNLLNDIFKNKKYKILVTIFDDGSSTPYDLSDYDVKYIKYVKNNGLQKLWKVIDDTFKYCKNIKSKYYIYLQDDLRLKENFFDRSVEIFEGISDEKKVSLATLIIDSQRGQPKWTGVNPVEFNEYYKSQWCELIFLCGYKFFESLEFKMIPINPSRWEKNPNLSSGVGEQISKRLVSLGYNMYQVKNTLTTHGDHESKLLPELRKNEKLIVK